MLNSTSLLFVGLGCSAGFIHAFSGPDHLAAIAPLALSDRTRASHTGALWGMGHGAGVAILGLLSLLIRDQLSVQVWSTQAEALVGVMLVLVGLWTIRQASNAITGHGEPVHTRLFHRHPQAQTMNALQSTYGKPIGIGVLHGMAGGSHVLGVLPTFLMNPWQAGVYLACYIVGATAAMTGFGLAVGMAVRNCSLRLLNQLMRSSGYLACGVGLFWVGKSYALFIN